MKIGIVGIGNELRGDDGIGPILVRLLQDGPLAGFADFYDHGIETFELRNVLKKHRCLFIIDALSYGAPGKIRIYTWRSKHVRGNPLSLHDFDLLWHLEYDNDTDCQIWLLGVGIVSVDWQIGLSPELNSALDYIEKDITNKIKKLVKYRLNGPNL